MVEPGASFSKPFPDEPISVVMPVHNALRYLDDAVRSILGQTHGEFEFVIFDDASTDGSTERLREWAAKDSRIRLHVGERNVGPARSSNIVVEYSSGSLIARMDADDIAHADRLRRQLDLLSRRPDVGVVGTLCNIIDSSGRRVRGPDVWRPGRRSWFAPFPHGSIMFRRGLFDQVGGYREECVFWEDQDLLLRMFTQAKVVTIPAALYEHRHSHLSTRLVSDQQRVERAVDLMYSCLQRLDQGRSYGDLLGSARAIQAEHRVDPRVFISLGSLELWAGGKPRLFRRLVRHGRLAADFRSMSAIVWTLWASSSPATLRLFMRSLAALRNGRAGRKPIGSEAVEWTLPSAVPAETARKASLPRPAPRSRVHS